MSLQRVLTLLGVLAAATSGMAVIVNLARDPFGGRRDLLEQRLQEIPSAPDDLGTAFAADCDKWMKTIEARPALWESLTPKAAAPPKRIDVAGAMKGVRLLPGSSGDRVRLATPEEPRGRMYKVGENITPNVVIKEVGKDAVTFVITQGSQTAEFSMDRK